MSHVEKLDSMLESLQVSLKGWQVHPHCDERTRIMQELERDIDEIHKKIIALN